MSDDDLVSTSSTLSGEERTWGMLCHLAAFLGLFGTSFVFIIPGLGGVLGPLAVWLFKKNEMPFVNDQGKESLNFQITVLIANLLCGLLIFVGVLISWGVIAFAVVMVIIASIKASNGETYRYPMTLRLIK